MFSACACPKWETKSAGLLVVLAAVVLMLWKVQAVASERGFVRATVVALFVLRSLIAVRRLLLDSSVTSSFCSSVSSRF